MIDIEVAEVFRPLWTQSARYKAAWGGRGGAKSHDRAAHMVVELLRGERCVGVREVQRSIRESVKRLIEDKIDALGVRSSFEITRDEIRSESGGQMVFQGLQDHSAESIKSLEGITRCWIEESQTISERSLRILLPTIRAPGCELWFTWNPRYDHDPVDMLLRGPEPPAGAIVVKANYMDNPWFPDDLRADMERDKRIDVEVYEHVWLGGYQRIGEGAYFAEELARMRSEGRHCSFPIERDPPIFTGWDIGIDDVTAIWAGQQVGREFHIIDYHEDRNQAAKHYAQWCLDNGYTGTALLPHDAGIREKGTLQSYEDHLRASGLKDTWVLDRTQNLLGDIQHARTFLPRCWFRDSPAVNEGLKALGAYRVEMDEKLRTPKPRPVHDWSSHCADSFRALSHLTPQQLQTGTERYGHDLRINFARHRFAANGRAGGTLGYSRGGPAS